MYILKFQFLNVEEHGNHFTVMCLDCWHHISDFYNFQQSVLKAQKRLLHENVEQFEVIVKSEVDIPPDTSHYNNFEENCNNELIKIKTEPESLLTIDDNPSQTDNTIPNDFISPAFEENSNHSDDIMDSSSSDLDREYLTEDEDSLANVSMKKVVVKNKPTESQKLEELDKFIAQHYPNLECVICSEPSPSFSQLQQHFRHQHPQEKCHIFCCERRLGSRFQIEEHVLLHNDPNAFQCSICSKNFSGRYTLYSHVYDEHRQTTNSQQQTEKVESAEEKARSRKKKSMELDALIAQWKPALQCLVCTSPFANFSHLRNHYRREHPNEACYIYCCGRKFNDRSKLGEHVRYHVDPNAYKCELCDAQHKTKRNLYFHIRTYHPQSRDGIAPDMEQIKKPPRKKRCITITSREIDNSIAQYRPSLDCDLCTGSCSNFTLLKTHFRLQHPSVAFYIQCCQRKFNNRSEFENHLRLHVNPNAFKCELCGKCLSSIKKLREHKKRIHFKHQNVEVQDNEEEIDID